MINMNFSVYKPLLLNNYRCLTFYSCHSITSHRIIPKNIKPVKSSKKKKVPLLKNIFLEDYNKKIESGEQYDIENFENFSEEFIESGRKYSKWARLKNIERKFFRGSFPKEKNFLTWKMKEQLLQLQNSDPDIWNEHTLSEIFLISEEGVKKVLKRLRNCQNLDPDQIKKHDENVLKNWRKVGKECGIGNVKLLEKRLNEKFSQVVAANLPAVQRNPQHDCEFLDSLIFTPTGDEEGERPLAKFADANKSTASLFKGILSRYKAQTQSEEADQSGSANPHTADHIPNWYQNHPDSGDSTVQVSHRSSLSKRRRRKLMTREEFISIKNEGH